MTDYGDTPAEPDPDNQGHWLANAIRTVRTPATALQWYGGASVVVAALAITLFLAAPDSVCDVLYKRAVRDQQELPANERKPLPPYGEFVQGTQVQVQLPDRVRRHPDEATPRLRVGGDRGRSVRPPVYE
jgi:hypothetical protein